MTNKLLLTTLTLLTILLSACDSSPDKSALAPELEGTLISSAAPIAIINSQQEIKYLYFTPIDCESCWKILEQMNEHREEFPAGSIGGIIMSEDIFAVYEATRAHFINLLPIYADHDENIAYDYDVEIEKAPLWVTIDESGKISNRSPTIPDAVKSVLK